MPCLGSQRFLRNESGATAALYALALPMLVVIGGVGFDYARLAGLDSEMQNAADQAALAAATQLDGKSGTCSRAAAAASGLVSNSTLLSNDGGGLAIAVANEGSCDATGVIRFWQDRDATVAATGDSNANFVEVVFDSAIGNARIANYALTPLAGVFYGEIEAAALAGLSSAICEVPPMMICSPDPTQPFNAAAKVGWGIQVTGHGNTRSGPGGTVGAWGPGDFGFLEVGAGQNSDLIEALAFDQSTLDCVPVDGTLPETGNPQGLYDAVNTRFDIYDFSSGNGTVLAPCFSGACPAASNVTKDVVKNSTNTTGNACKFSVGGGAPGWKLPPDAEQFWPKPYNESTGSAMQIWNDQDVDSNPGITAMGLPRDLCHYTSYGSPCPNDVNHRFGNGLWARGDYFAKNHPTDTPLDASSMTRYQTYLWELGLWPTNTGTTHLPASVNGQRSAPLCSPSYGAASSPQRRVLTVAIVKNCSSLSGASTAVQVEEWVDMFLVEPVVDSRGNGSIADSIYMEVIGPATLGDSGVSTPPQSIRKDAPYLVR